jgi:hypothetical protein
MTANCSMTWFAAVMLCCSCWLRQEPSIGARAFSTPSILRAPTTTRRTQLAVQQQQTVKRLLLVGTLRSKGNQDDDEEYDNDDDDDSAIQWELFNRYHNKGSWKGIWTTYDYMGDVALETIASVDYQQRKPPSANGVEVSHVIVVGATTSDCETCFDSMETRTIPVSMYTPHNFAARKTRLGACGMVVGPSLLRNGASTLCLPNTCILVFIHCTVAEQLAHWLTFSLIPLLTFLLVHTKSIF